MHKERIQQGSLLWHWWLFGPDNALLGEAGGWEVKAILCIVDVLQHSLLLLTRCQECPSPGCDNQICLKTYLAKCDLGNKITHENIKKWELLKEKNFYPWHLLLLQSSKRRGPGCRQPCRWQTSHATVWKPPIPRDVSLALGLIALETETWQKMATVSLSSFSGSWTW